MGYIVSDKNTEQRFVLACSRLKARLDDDATRKPCLLCIERVNTLKRESLLSTLSLSMNDAELPATTIIRPRRSLIMDLVATFVLFLFPYFFILFVFSFFSLLSSFSPRSCRRVF